MKSQSHPCKGIVTRAPDLEIEGKDSLRYAGIAFCALHIPIWVYINAMPRATTTSDAFNAVAEPRRRDILTFLAFEERTVGEIVDALGMGQPSVSKHLRVLKEVGLVSARRDGQNMLYRTEAAALRPLHEWTQTFERLWSRQLLRIKERAEKKS